jgi:prepilin-type N-terminal cleavage/methylation domain-containing protein/prepilin-type processing-associated H-X9-DG protein
MRRHRLQAGATGCHRGFTLVELLVVVAIVALLISILLPSLRRAREQARAAVCGSNIRQIALANIGYAAENGGRFCPGAADHLANKHRWHGARDNISQPFDGSRGLLVAYLTEERGIRDCPSFAGFAESSIAFERGCGGYGYNQGYLGRVLKDVGFGFFVVEDDRTGVQSERVRQPGATVMFSDAAFPAAGGGVIEYSFAEPRFHPTNPAFRSDPSIHFRHDGRASVAWVDGHADRHLRTFTWSSVLISGDAATAGLGWFGQADDNRLFDLE